MYFFIQCAIEISVIMIFFNQNFECKIECSSPMYCDMPALPQSLQSTLSDVLSMQQFDYIYLAVHRYLSIR